MLKNPISLVPSSIKPFSTDYNCPLKEINVKKYNVIIDGDTENDRIYLNLGYDNHREYDSSFFLNSKDALELGMKLIQYSHKATSTHEKYVRSKDWINKLKEFVKNKMITDIGIKCVSTFSDDPEDSLFGSLVLQIYYITRTGYSDEAIVVSDIIGNKSYNYFDEIIEKLKNEYDVENIFIDSDGYKKFKTILDNKLNKWIEKTKRPQPLTQKVDTMIPNNLKDGVKDIADRVITKIKETKTE